MAVKDITDKQVLEAYLKFQENNELWPYEYLGQVTGEPLKVCYRALERASKRDLIDYGVSLRSGWITAKGKALLDKEQK